MTELELTPTTLVDRLLRAATVTATAMDSAPETVVTARGSDRLATSLVADPVLVTRLLRKDTEAGADASTAPSPSPPPVPSDRPLRLHHGIFEVADKATDVLGRGSYGTVYSGVQRSLPTDIPVAVKTHHDAFLLDREVQLYQYLWRHKRAGGAPGLRIPRLLWEGTTDDGSARVVVLDRLGTSLDQLFDRGGQVWGHETVCWVACEALRLLEGLHALGVVHRDLKPDNFAIGHGKADRHRLYTFDFGLSSQYLNKEGAHQPFREGLSLIGTMRYASLNNHAGKQQSRRDDLESLGYVLWCLSVGTLPWKHAGEGDTKGGAGEGAGEDDPKGNATGDRASGGAVEAVRAPDAGDTGLSSGASVGALASAHTRRPTRKERNAAIATCKAAVDLATVPWPFGEFIQYARELAYDEAPDYAPWIARFEALAGSAARVPDWLLETVHAGRRRRTGRRT